MMRRIFVYLIFVLLLTSCNRKFVGTWISVDSEQIIITSTADLGMIIDFNNSKVAHIRSDLHSNITHLTNKEITIDDDISYNIEGLSDDTLIVKDENTIYKFIELKDGKEYSFKPEDFYNTRLELSEDLSFILDSAMFRNGKFGNVRNLLIKKSIGEKVNGYWLMNNYLGHNFLFFQYYDTEVLLFEIVNVNNDSYDLYPFNKDCFGIMDKKEYKLINN